ncbi:TetR/AcrR family transcriptional regulator [Alphaproteobacteria bacterium]|nr:TetR/AcrR family transcriptional regulator [Alphaproteobacteria bacterium]
MYQELISVTPHDRVTSNRRSRTRKDILRAALELVEAGRPMTVQAIADQSGVSKPTIYRYYNSPEEIERDAFLSELGAERGASFVTAVQQIIADNADVRVRIQRMAELLPQLLETNGAFLRGLMTQHYRKAGERPEWLMPAIQQMIYGALEPVRNRLTMQDFKQLAALLSGYLLYDGFLIHQDRAVVFDVEANETVRIGIDILLDRYLGPAASKRPDFRAI